MVPPLSWMLLLVSFRVSPCMFWMYIPLPLFSRVLFCSVAVELFCPSIQIPQLLLLVNVLLVMFMVSLVLVQSPQSPLLVLVVLVICRFWLLVLPIRMYIPWLSAWVTVVLSIMMLFTGPQLFPSSIIPWLVGLMICVLVMVIPYSPEVQYSFCMALDLVSVIFVLFMVTLVRLFCIHMACCVLLVMLTLFMVVFTLVPPIQMACKLLLLMFRSLSMRLSESAAYTA